MRVGSFELMDEFSGIPLPISPQYADERPSRYPRDRHHPWHDALDPLLQGVGGKALRESRIQITNYDAHHLDYHGAGLRPTLPEYDSERIRPILLSAADYVPEYGIAFTRDGAPYRTRFSDEIRTWLRDSGTIRIASVQVVRRFLCANVIDQALNDISPGAVDEFLFTADPLRKWELGNDILARASRRAAAPAEEPYREAYKAGLIPKKRGQIASRFLLASLGLKRHRSQLFGTLEARLAA